MQSFKWIKFYMEFASKILSYKNKRKELIGILQTCFQETQLKFPFVEKANEPYEDICPFTVFGSFNRKLTDKNRSELLAVYAKKFDIKSETPSEFEGVPVLINFNAWFFAYKDERGEHDIDHLWNLYESAIRYAEYMSDSNRAQFIESYDTVIKQKQAKWNITIGLYWIRPYTFINLDSINRTYMTDNKRMPEAFTSILPNLMDLPDGKNYIALCEKARKILDDNACSYKTFPELSYNAWFLSQTHEQKNTIPNNKPPQSPPSELDNVETEQTLTETPEPYTKKEFLREVYMSEAAYDELTQLVDYKYNVILQGAPGVGKTFAAKRLAYAMMGEKDERRVAMVQFHQSYAYEDFIQGYKPARDGFELRNGVFYDFCKAAEQDSGRLYFFIVDEINRGNLSKILGELMMLIEKDKRGQSLKLLYADETFSVPSNIRILGMMNTADRSLAMMDYALRRRFAFFEFTPAFDSDGFQAYLNAKASPKLERLVTAIRQLNEAIAKDEDLGEGFRIGHSYFCIETAITDSQLRAVVEYEVLPLLKEYWFDEPSKTRDWAARLRAAIAPSEE